MHDYVILDSHVTRQEENDGEGRGSEILKSLEMEAGGVAYKRKKASEKESKKERREKGSITTRFGNGPKKCPLQLSLDLVTTTTSVYVTDLLTCPCSSSVQLPIVIYSGFKLNLSHPSQKSLDVWIVEQKYAWFGVVLLGFFLSWNPNDFQGFSVLNTFSWLDLFRIFLQHLTVFFPHSYLPLRYFYISFKAERILDEFLIPAPSGRQKYCFHPRLLSP